MYNNNIKGSRTKDRTALATLRQMFVIASVITMTACSGGGDSTDEDTAPVVPEPLQQSTLPVGLSDFQPDNEPDPVLPDKNTAEWTKAVNASRLLTQTTFGPTAKEVAMLMDVSAEEWLENQFAQPMSVLRPMYEQALEPIGYEVAPNPIEFDKNYLRHLARSDMIWRIQLRGNDQLRQRVALALSEILVVSERENAVYDRPRALVEYHDILARNAFGNYRELLEEVTLSMSMARYLSMYRNQKADEARNIRPDENYAREILQLFSIGLYELNLDGTRKLDNNNLPIPTYGQDEIKTFARVFTGWADGNGENFWDSPHQTVAAILPLKAFEYYHDKEEKTVFNNVTLPANQTAQQDLDDALDNIFDHPNVAPFISKQLIQRLVTSNPSPAYVERVATVFNSNSSGIKGDLQAVVKAIILDDEARNLPADTSSYGKLKEPLLRVANLWRSMKIHEVEVKKQDSDETESFRFRFNDGSRLVGQSFYSSPSVFNFFQPDFAQPGPVNDSGLVSPEFQILNDSFAIATSNTLRNAIWYRSLQDVETYDSFARTFWGESYPPININDEKLIANNLQKLIDKFNLLFYGGQMSEFTETTLINHLTELQLEYPFPYFLDNEIIYEALWLSVITPEAAIQK